MICICKKCTHKHTHTLYKYIYMCVYAKIGELFKSKKWKKINTKELKALFHQTLIKYNFGTNIKTILS